MFRQMRRFKQQLSQEESLNILEKGTAGVLALAGDEGYPYAVPISYTYLDGKLVFHGAKSGHKIDAIMANEKASFCVIAQDEIVPEEYTTYFRSVIAFGKIRIIEEEAEKRQLAFELGKKYRPGFKEETYQEVDKELSRICMMVLEIEHMTGKEAIELRRQKMENK